MGDIMIQNLEELFDHIGRKVFNFHMMDRIIALANNLDAEFTFDMETYKKAADGLIAAKSEVDIRVFRYYVPIFKIIFMRAGDWEQSMRYIYEHAHFKTTTEQIPALRDAYPTQKFDSDSSNVIKQIIKSTIDNTSKEFEQLCKEFSFYLTIAPKPTIHNFISAGVYSNNMNHSMDLIINVLRRIPAFFSLRVPHTYFPQRNELLVIALFRRLMCTDYRNQFKKLEAITYLSTQLTCTYLPPNEPEKKIPPIFEVNELLVDLVIDLLERSKESQSTLLNILTIILPLPNGNDIWEINWKRPGVTSDNYCVDPQSLQNAIYDIFKNEGPFKPRKQICNVYGLLYKRLKFEEYPMTECQEEIFIEFLKEEEDKERAEEQKKAEQEARLKAEEEARQKAEEDAIQKAEEEARCKFEEEMRIKAEEEDRRKREKMARQKIEEDKKKEQEEIVQKAEEARQNKMKEAENLMKTEAETQHKAAEKHSLQTTSSQLKTYQKRPKNPLRIELPLPTSTPVENQTEMLGTPDTNVEPMLAPELIEKKTIEEGETSTKMEKFSEDKIQQQLMDTEARIEYIDSAIVSVEPLVGQTEDVEVTMKIADEAIVDENVEVSIVPPEFIANEKLTEQPEDEKTINPETEKKKKKKKPQREREFSGGAKSSNSKKDGRKIRSSAPSIGNLSEGDKPEESKAKEEKESESQLNEVKTKEEESEPNQLNEVKTKEEPEVQLRQDHIIKPQKENIAEDEPVIIPQQHPRPRGNSHGFGRARAGSASPHQNISRGFSHDPSRSGRQRGNHSNQWHSSSQQLQHPQPLFNNYGGNRQPRFNRGAFGGSYHHNGSHNNFVAGSQRSTVFGGRRTPVDRTAEEEYKHFNRGYNTNTDENVNVLDWKNRSRGTDESSSNQ